MSDEIPPSLSDRLIEIARSLEFPSDASFRFQGLDYRVDQDPWSLPVDQPIPPRDRLVHAVSLVLYYGAYCPGNRSELVVDPHSLPSDPAFVGQLSEANQTRQPFEIGWQLLDQRVDGTVQVSKSGRFRSAAPADYERDESPIGLLYRLRIVREQRDWLPMFYFAHSETLPNQFEDRDNLRFYFHCDPSEATKIIRSVTGTLNRYETPFRLKCLNHPKLYGRSDALVLYLEKRYAPFVARCLIHLEATEAWNLSESVPLFTRRLAPGISIAEDPGDGQSFGQQRCRLLAEAMIDAYQSGCLHKPTVVDKIASRFRRDGFRLATPHLNPGSVDWLDIPERAS